MHPYEKRPSVVVFLEAAVAHYKALGVTHGGGRATRLPAFLTYYNVRRPHSAWAIKPQLPGSRETTYCNSTAGPPLAAWQELDTEESAAPNPLISGSGVFT